MRIEDAHNVVQLRSGLELERFEVELEIADVLLFLLRLCDKLEIDPLQAAHKKLELNAEKYPVDKARGRATKYDKL